MYEISEYDNGDEIISIENNDKEFFKQISQIWNKIIELIGINNTPNFVQTTLDDDGSKFTEADVLKNTSFIESCHYKDKLIMVLHSVINNCLKSSLIQRIKHVN